MNLETSSQSCFDQDSDNPEPTEASQPSESHQNDTVNDLEKSSLNTPATSHELDNGSQSASLCTASIDTMNEDAHIILTDSIESCPGDGKAENTSEEVDLTPDTLHSPNPNCSVSEPRPDEDDFGIPSSSPPASSPLSSKYFRSSSPIPMASSPGYNMTPPTSPVKGLIFKEVRDIEQTESDFDQPSIASETITATVMPAVKRLEPCKNKDDADLTDHGGADRKKAYERLIPGPKRTTLAAQKAQHRRLSKPFRPPTVQKVEENVKAKNAVSITAPVHEDEGPQVALRPSSFAQKMHEKVNKRSAKAAAQFKSPLTCSSAGDEAAPLVRPTPTIQALERRLQMLKRAVKVKEKSEEEVLSGLIQKWTEAGREIALEVWGLVKDRDGVGRRKRQVEDRWGWEDGGETKRQKTEERLWGWDVVPVREREEEEEEETGTIEGMLRELGILPEILFKDRE